MLSFQMEPRRSTLRFFHGALTQALPEDFKEVLSEDDILHKARILTTNVWISNHNVADQMKAIKLAEWFRIMNPRSDDHRVMKIAAEFCLIFRGFFPEHLIRQEGTFTPGHLDFLGRKLFVRAADTEPDEASRLLMIATGVHFKAWCNGFTELWKLLNENRFVPPELLIAPPSGLIC
jgi:hypothetical protein